MLNFIQKMYNQKIAIYSLALGLAAFAPHNHAQADNYIQGSYGFGMLADLDAKTNGVSTSLAPAENAGMMGVEVGIDRYGADRKLKIGVGYQAFETDFDGTTNKLSGKLYSANGYYYLGTKVPEDNGLHPYVGAGLILADYGDYPKLDGKMKFGLAVHVGADMPVSDTISVGGKYSYIMVDGPTGGDSTSSTNFEDLTMNLFMANVTYHFKGGIMGN